MTLVNTDYSIAPLWRSRIVNDSMAIPLGFDSSPGQKKFPNVVAIYIYIYIYIRWFWFCVCGFGKRIKIT